MMNKNVVLDEVKVREYKEVIRIIKDTVKKEELARICLENNTLQVMAGLKEGPEDITYNQYVKDFLDKLIYDEHNRKVDEAKKNNDTDKLQALSDEVMAMAGYKDSEGTRFNKYAKSFVDRSFIDRELNRLYKAISAQNQEGIDEAYRRIYQMTSYSENQPFGVVNECAQGFVDSRIEEFEEKGIHVPQQIDSNEISAI